MILRTLLHASVLLGVVVCAPPQAHAFKDFGATFSWKDKLYIRQPVSPAQITFRSDDFQISNLNLKADERVVAMAVDDADDTAYMLVQSKPGSPVKVVISGKFGTKSVSLPEDFDVWERRIWLLAHEGKCVIVVSNSKAYLLQGERWVQRELNCTETAGFLRGQPQNITLDDDALYFNYWGGEFGSGIVSCSLKDMRWYIEDTRFSRRSVDTSGSQMFNAYQREMVDSSIRDYVFDGEIWGLTDREILHKVDEKWVSVATLPDDAVESISSIWKSLGGVVYTSTGLGNVYRLENDTLRKLETQPLVDFIAGKRAEDDKSKSDSDAPSLPVTTRLLAVTENYVLLADSFNSLLALDLKTKKVLKPLFSDQRIAVLESKKER